VVSDFDMTEALLTYFLRKVHARRRLFSPRLLLAVPAGINAIEKRALFNAAERAGTRKVYLLDEPRAAGLGAGIPIHQARASMIVDIGGGTTDITILSLADTVVSSSIKTAGDAMDEAIIKHIQRNYNNLIGWGTAEAIKIALGSVAPRVEDASMTVSGRDVIAGLPRGVTVTAEDVRAALLEPVGIILDAIRDVLERAGPELAGDLFQNGMTLCGGGVLLDGFADLVAAQTGLPVRLAEDPLSTVARGTAIFLECLDDFKHILESGDDDL
jgi:rod shape-determining protein MreB